MTILRYLIPTALVLALGVATVGNDPKACDDPIITDREVTVTCTVDGVSATHTALISTVGD